MSGAEEESGEKLEKRAGNFSGIPSAGLAGCFHGVGISDAAIGGLENVLCCRNYFRGGRLAVESSVAGPSGMARHVGR